MRQVDAYVNSQEQDAQLSFADMRKVQVAFAHFRVRQVAKTGPATSAQKRRLVVQSSLHFSCSPAHHALLLLFFTQKTLARQGTARDGTVAERLAEMEDLLKQRDREVNVLIAKLKREREKNLQQQQQPPPDTPSSAEQGSTGCVWIIGLADHDHQS